MAARAISAAGSSVRDASALAAASAYGPPEPHMKTTCHLTVFVAACCLLAGGCAAGGGDDPGTPAGDVADSGGGADSVVVDADADTDTAELSGDTTCVPMLEFAGEPESPEYGADIVMVRNGTRTPSWSAMNT